MRFECKFLFGVAAAVVLGNATASHAASVFTENMGTPSGTTAISANTFQNSGTLTYSGTGDVRATTTSSGYTGASAGGNVFLTNNGTATFEIGGINTAPYDGGSITLTLGAYKSTTASNLVDSLRIEYSTDGTNYTALTYAAQATGTGTAVYRLLSLDAASNAAIPSTSNLRLRFSQINATGAQIRIDDVALSGNVPEPTTAAAGLLVGGLLLARRRRARLV